MIGDGAGGGAAWRAPRARPNRLAGDQQHDDHYSAARGDQRTRRDSLLGRSSLLRCSARSSSSVSLSFVRRLFRLFISFAPFIKIGEFTTGLAHHLGPWGRVLGSLSFCVVIRSASILYARVIISI